MRSLSSDHPELERLQWTRAQVAKAIGMTVSDVHLRAPRMAIVEVQMGECRVSETREYRLDLLQRRSDSPIIERID